MELTDQIREAGEPLPLGEMFDEDTRRAVHAVATQSMAAAVEAFPEDAQRQVAEAILGIYAHGFLVGSLNTL